jgi:hypothetical protein
MFDWYKYDFIKPIDKNSKIIIGLGDSFTEGLGACSEKLWKRCDWDLNNVTVDKLKEYQISYYENSWVHKLAKNHMPDFIPINMGMAGRGNRAAVKELHLHPELNLSDAKEKIVVFMLSGYERFDFVNREYFEHIHFETMWPWKNQNVPQRLLWDAYSNHIWSDRVAIIEMILSISEAKLWCKANNAKFVLCSAFRNDYQRTNFINLILNDCDCNKGRTPNYLLNREDHVEKLVDIIDWENFLRPKRFSCMVDLLLHLEDREDLMGGDNSQKFYDFSYSLEKLSPKGYISNCGHPSEKGQEAMAESIFEHINKVKLI